LRTFPKKISEEKAEERSRSLKGIEREESTRNRRTQKIRAFGVFFFGNGEGTFNLQQNGKKNRENNGAPKRVKPVRVAKAH